MDNLYDVLEVSSSASQTDIKKAYKKLAMKYHPDRGGDPEKFKKISEAYSILSDDEKRRRYDQYGTVDMTNMEMPDMNDLFNNIFGFPFGGGGSGSFFHGGNGPSSSSRRKGASRQVILEVTMEEVIKGATVSLSIQRKRYTTGTRCQTCKGQGHMVQQMNLGIGFVTQNIVQCHQCQGDGKQYSDKDIVTVEETIQVPLPKGIPDGNKLVIRNKGDEYPDKESGDIYLVVSYKKHKFYRPSQTKPLDIDCTIPLSLYEFLYGFEKSIKLLDDSILTLVQPKGQPLQKNISGPVKKVITYKGFSYKGNKGDLVISFTIVFPELSQTTEKLIKTHFSPTPHNLQIPFLSERGQTKENGVIYLDRV